MTKQSIPAEMKNLLLLVTILFSNLLFSPVSAQQPGLEVGNLAPEITLPSPSGEIIKLSSLKGKVVLIDFWATWCSPCIQEQPVLARLYKKYKGAVFTNGNGFEIYGVSFDSKKSSWEEVVKKYKITWIQVSDLKFWKSAAAQTYNVKELPYNLLIDGNGIILAKNLHGDELAKELESLVKKPGK